jgi:hypothetical protein
MKAVKAASIWMMAAMDNVCVAIEDGPSVASVVVVVVVCTVPARDSADVC